MNTQLRTGVTVSASMILAATSAVADTKNGLRVVVAEPENVSEDVIAAIDNAIAKKDVKDAVSEAFNSLVTRLSDTDKTLAENYFAEYLKTDENGNPFVETGVQVAQFNVCGIGCYTNCYNNCHGACHSACHASRGWR